MGHESQIEPWLAHDQRSACWFHKSLASSRIEYENRREKTHKRYAVVRSVPSLWSGKREQILLDYKGGLEINKNPAEGEVFFVDFPSYRTFQAEQINRCLLGRSAHGPCRARPLHYKGYAARSITATSTTAPTPMPTPIPIFAAVEMPEL